MPTTSRRELESSPLCPKCGSHRTRIVGQSGNPPVTHYRCQACKYVFSHPLGDWSPPDRATGRASAVNQQPADAVRELLPVLDSKLNDLMFSLYRTRQALMDMQQGIGTDASMLGRVGEALASVRDSERVLVDIQQRLEAVRRQD